MRKAAANPPLRDSRFEDHHCSLYQLGELVQDLRHRLPLDGLNIGERYQDGDLKILVNVTLTTGHELEFIFAAAPPFSIGWGGAPAWVEGNLLNRGLHSNQIA